MFLCVYACKKDRDESSSLTPTQLIAEAKSHFNDDLLTVTIPLLNERNLRHRLNKIPLWHKAKVKKTSFGDAVIVPIKFTDQILLKDGDSQNFTDLNKVAT